MFTTANMGLTCWNLLTDVFSHSQLEANFQALDGHNHTSGQGVQIPTGGIANGAITTAKLATNAVADSNIQAATITLDKLAAGVARFAPLETTAGTVTAVDGQLLFCYGGGAQTVNLPASPSTGATVAVIAVNPSTVVTVQGNGHQFEGVGIGAASSFQLGTPGAKSWLVFDGLYWVQLAGQQDTGWQALSLATNIASGGYGAAARLQGDIVRLKGTLTNNTGGGDSATIATLSAGLRPSATINLAVGMTGGGTVACEVMQINTSGNLALPVTGEFPSGYTVSLDGLTFSLS